MKLVGLPVFTDMGDRVGAVKDLEYDENGQVKIYHIKPKGIFGFLKKDVLIYPASIISIDEEKMIVRGTEIKVPAIKAKEALVSS
jgi:sporulation protein YlmC with PRC-barrel domain